MARLGCRVLLVEKDDEQSHGRRYDIFHLGQESFARFGVQQPGEGDADFVRRFSRTTSRSALDRYPKNAAHEVLVLHRHEFMKRLKERALDAGVTVLHEAQFISPVWDSNGKLAGGVILHEGEAHTISARLVADASGIPSAVRTALPDGYGVENFEIGPRDKFYVVLYYVKLDDPMQGRVELTCSWPYYKTWIAPQEDPDGAILGVGANLSFDYAKACFARFASRIQLPPHKVVRVEQGCTPYHRPPYSFVANGFVALGDAACLTNPWSGEGVAAAWVQAEIAIEEAGSALENGSYPTRESLWRINTRYYAAQGAQFAQMLSMLAGAVDCSPQENDYEFEHSIIFKDEDEKNAGSLFGGILRGVLTGKLKFATLGNLAGAAQAGKKIVKHYENYPARPADFPAWQKKADLLWKRARSMADAAEKDANRMKM